MNSLQELMGHIDGIYAPRNMLVRSDLADRMGFLDIAVGKLYRCYRKGKREDLGVKLAHMFSRICCVAENFRGELRLWETMAGKYPLTHCSYCGKMPCECAYVGRPASVAVSVSTEQLSWSLYQWQNHLEKLYGEQNRGPNRGPKDVLLQIFGEVTELLEVAEDAPLYSIDTLIRLFSEELSDVLAWTIGFANLFGINLEEMVDKIYGNGCPACSKPSCKCPIFRFKKDRVHTETP